MNKMALVGIAGKKQHGKDTVCKIIQFLTAVEAVSIDTMVKYKSFNDYLKSSESPGFYQTSSWQKKMFAEKVKQIVCLLIGCTMEQLEDEQFKNRELGEEWWYYIRIDNTGYSQSKVLLPYLEWKYNSLMDNVFPTKLTPRLFLQLLGTECGRQIIHPNIWVNALMADYKAKSLKNNPQLGVADYSNSEFPNWIITDVRFPNEVKAVEDREGIIIRVTNPRVESTSTHESEIALDHIMWPYNRNIYNDGTIEDLIPKVKEILTLNNLL